ncbi:MAG TPA: hypothetical protein QF753_15385 [Victivallales bacterium]|nr:hypothetical protein [Victivallales bacterium]
MYNQDVEFYCMEKKSSIVIPISECYKTKQVNKRTTIYNVKSIDDSGNCLIKKICKNDYESLACRNVEY